MKNKSEELILKIKNWYQLCSPIKNQRGVAIVVALLLLVVLAALVPVTMNMITPDVDRTRAYEDSRKAFYIAEAGIERAKDDLLTGFNVDNTYSTIDDVLSAADATTDVIENLDSIAFGVGTYTVTVVDNDDGDGDLTTDVDNVIFLQSTATVDGQTKTLQARITEQTASSGTPFFGTRAVSTEADLTINGNPTIQGSGGSVHSNSNLEITGNPTVEQAATATGSYTITGNPSVGSGSGGSKSKEDLPDVTISDYKQYADYVMGADGIVRDANGNQLFDGSGGDKYNAGGCNGSKGWEYSSGPPVEWKIGDDCGGDGKFYVEGNITISGNPGHANDPWQVSLMAEGNINISGNPQFTNYKDANDSAGVQNIFMLAGTDIEWSGNPSNTIEGFIYAGEQIKLNGNPTIEGFIIAKDKANTDDHVEQNSISGNPTITFSGSLDTPFTINTSGDVSLTIVSWNEL